jgi:hAT family C-terminal dimerisation region
MPSDALQHLSGLLRKFDDSVTKHQLQTELLDFARKWESFETTLEDEYNLLFDTEVSDSVLDNIRQSEPVEFETVFTIPAAENSDRNKNKCKSCKKCIVCCYFVLQKFNLHSLAYSNLFLAYKFVLTLSSSQVACERSFSKLKYILNRLRNLLSQSSLQSFMLMSCEKDLLPRINNNEIIDFLASTSETMKKLL